MLLVGGCTGGPERYTILLAAIMSPDHVALTDRMKDQAKTQTGWKGMFVVHEDGISRLYLGKYATPDNANWDLKKAQRFKLSDGYRPFARATIVAIPSSLIGPPEHDLTRTGGDVTLVIAKFYDVPEANYFGREPYAIEYCQQLRDEGHPAYYCHVGINSYVTVGSFPQSAYRMKKDERGRPTTDVYYAPELKALMDRFPLLSVNGRVEYRVMRNPRTGHEERRAASSYIMEVPKRPGDYVQTANPAGQ